uniref:t-SNARE coiled-coil homology domain-containing protein n=1 Tax=Oryza rufipogon TaxID=4529 RepID=A0A0E0NE78_ORYRU
MVAFSSSLSCRACNARWHEVRAWNMSSTTSLTPSSPAPRRHHASHRVAPSLRIVNCLRSYVSHQSPPLHLVNRLRASTCLGLFNNVSRLDLIHRKEQKRPIHLGIFLKSSYLLPVDTFTQAYGGVDYSDHRHQPRRDSDTGTPCPCDSFSTATPSSDIFCTLTGNLSTALRTRSACPWLPAPHSTAEEARKGVGGAGGQGQRSRGNARDCETCLLRNLTQGVFEMSGRRSFFASKKPSRSSNPFDSDSDDGGREQRPARASSVPPPADQRGSLFGGGDGFSASSAAARSRYRNDFRDTGGVEAQSVQELEGYAAYKAEETTQRVQGCVRIAEEMRDTASKSLVTIHQQGQQITRTHMMTLDIDQDLSRSEKLLGDLGGIFSKKWKPKKNGEIRGPMLTRDDSFIRKGSHLEQRHKLGLSDHPPQSNARQFHSEPTSALQKVEMEKAKQDDGLSDLSNILTELKGMAVDMGTEIDRQTKALGDSEKDYDELNFRIKGANTRARRLLGK